MKRQVINLKFSSMKSVTSITDMLKNVKDLRVKIEKDRYPIKKSKAVPGVVE